MPPKVKETEETDPSQSDAYTEHVRRAVAQGLADIEAGRVMDTKALKEHMERKFGPIKWR